MTNLSQTQLNNHIKFLVKQAEITNKRSITTRSVTTTIGPYLSHRLHTNGYLQSEPIITVNEHPLHTSDYNNQIPVPTQFEQVLIDLAKSNIPIDMTDTYSYYRSPLRAKYPKRGRKNNKRVKPTT